MIAKCFETELIHKVGNLEVADYGSKAVRLRRIANLGLSVPSGFLLSKDFVSEAVNSPKFTISGIFENLEGLYALRASPTERDWGSVDTILNLGISDVYVKQLAIQIGHGPALEVYRRFINSFSVLVFGLDLEIFEELYHKESRLINPDQHGFLDENVLLSIVELSKRKFKQKVGREFPQSLEEQLDLAFVAMSKSWYRPSALILRTSKGASNDAGMGIILQKMVLGIGPTFSGSGRVSTIDHDTGEPKLKGYFFVNSQGYDQIAGSGRHYVLTEEQKIEEDQKIESLQKLHSSSFTKIQSVVEKISTGLKDSFDLEFTIDKNDFYVLDAVISKRSARASVRVAVDLVKTLALTEEQALLKVPPQNLIEFLHPQISSSFSRDLVGVGLPASPGAVSGRVVFSSHAASILNARGKSAILVRIETSPEDIAGIHDSVGVLTTRGGMTSHAAVIARGLGLPCVVGVSSLTMNIPDKTMISENGHTFKEGDLITLDGTSGEVLDGSAEMTQPEISGAFSTLMEWADRYRCISVRGNADTLQEVQLAKDFGADGIGLCRTEHMFFEPKRLLVMREMILAEEEEKRREALSKLLPMQRSDFIRIFQIMKGRPVTIRLLDPPLHEFLPNSEDEIRMIANALGEPLSKIIERSKNLEEFNPMLGKRGVRLGITLPEIYEMQVQAIFEAAHFVNQEGLYHIVPEIMIPLVSTKKELEFISQRIRKISESRSYQLVPGNDYKLGAVLETPRAALRAHELSSLCDFLSFGTNDLTQMTYGLSRDDAGRFMREYIEKNIFHTDPFHSLDSEGVGELILLAVERARSLGKSIELGLCGEHGGDPNSIKFCVAADFNYVSCSPFRIPIARLAAAQASVIQKLQISD